MIQKLNYTDFHYAMMFIILNAQFKLTNASYYVHRGEYKNFYEIVINNSGKDVMLFVNHKVNNTSIGFSAIEKYNREISQTIKAGKILDSFSDMSLLELENLYKSYSVKIDILNGDCEIAGNDYQSDWATSGGQKHDADYWSYVINTLNHDLSRILLERDLTEELINNYDYDIEETITKI